MTQLVTRFVVSASEYDTYLEVVDVLNECFGEHGWHWPHASFTAKEDGMPKLKSPLLAQMVVVKGFGIASPFHAVRDFR